MPSALLRDAYPDYSSTEFVGSGEKQPKQNLKLNHYPAVDSEGRRISIADAHRGDGRRFIVYADEKLSAFVELEHAIHAFAVGLIA